MSDKPMPPTVRRMLEMLLKHGHIEAEPGTNRLRFVTEMPKGIGWIQLESLHKRGLVFPLGDSGRYWYANHDAHEALKDEPSGPPQEATG